MVTINGKHYYTSGELFKELNVHPMTIWRWKKRGLIPVHKLPTQPNRDYYLKEDILKMTPKTQENSENA